MRRQLVTTVVAVTSMVLVAFLVPLGILVQRTAADRAVRAATLETDAVRALLGSSDRATLESLLAQLAVSSRRRTTVYLPDGSRLGAAAPADAAVRTARAERRTVERDERGGGGGRVLATPVAVSSGDVAVIRVLVPDSELRGGVTRTWLVLGLLGVTLLGLAVLVADRLGRRFVRPTVGLADVATRLASGDLAARSSGEGPPELRRVGAALDRLAARIDELLTLEREGVADLSHRLRTPLAALRLEAEGVAGAPGLGAAEAARLLDAVDAVERSVDALIMEARRPTASAMPATSSCDAVAVVRERAAFWRVLAEDQGRPMEVSLPAGERRVALDEVSLGAALDVLLGNVFGHTDDGVALAVAVHDRGASVAVVVDDVGPGLPGLPGPVGQGDGAGMPGGAVLRRGVSTAGSTGLGLDIARRTAEAARGKLVLGRSAAGGARVELLLPRAEHAPPADR